MSWRKQRKSRWDCLKTDTKQTEETTKPITSPVMNNRWRRKPESPREDNSKPKNSRFALPVSPVRTGRAKNVELSWEQILETNNNLEIKTDKISHLLNPVIPKEDLDKTYNILKFNRQNIREEQRNLTKETSNLYLEQEGILKRKDELKQQLKKIKLVDYEDELRGKKPIGGYAADLELRKKIKRSNRRDNINQDMSRLKKKYMENKKTIKINESILNNHIRDYDRITKRMNELLNQIGDKDGFYVKYTEPKKVKTPIKKVIKLEITEYEKTEKEAPWWSSSREVIPVRYYDWSAAMKNVDLNINCDDTVSEQSEVSTDKEDTSEDIVEKIVIPVNPYAELCANELKKRIRSFNKKLRQIAKLELRTGLSEAELEKVKRRGEFENELRLLNEVKPL